MMQPNVIYEDNHIMVVYKPAGMASQTARLAQKDIVSELKNYLAEQSAHKGEPYIGLIHRLDQPVEGLLVLAKDKESAADLSNQITGHDMNKYYYALILGEPACKEGERRDYLLQEAPTNRSEVVTADTPNAKEASLRYKVMSGHKGVSLVEIQLETGRHHQIRVQMSHAGMPLIGDTKYGSEPSKEKSRQMNCSQIALCAYRLEFIHPKTKDKRFFEIKPSNQVFLPFFAN